MREILSSPFPTAARLHKIANTELLNISSQQSVILHSFSTSDNNRFFLQIIEVLVIETTYCKYHFLFKDIYMQLKQQIFLKKGTLHIPLLY